MVDAKIKIKHYLHNMKKWYLFISIDIKTKLLNIFYSIFQYAINYRTICFYTLFNPNLVMCKGADFG